MYIILHRETFTSWTVNKNETKMRGTDHHGFRIEFWNDHGGRDEVKSKYTKGEFVMSVRH